MKTVSSQDIELENCARINNADLQFGPAIYGDALIFVSRPRVGKLNPTTKKPFFKLFSAKLTPDGTPLRPRRFSTELNSNYNEGPVSFTQEDRVIFFTRTLQREGTTVEDATGTANLGIYSAYRGQYDWMGVRPLPFNSIDFSNQHPTVTPDGKRVFFSSNRPGGYGGFDLYFSDYFDGRWSPAINLGAEINTEGNEAFPHIHDGGKLFFASDGHGGQGGYDLFLIDLSERKWGKLINLPAPVNSRGDDVGLSLTADGKRAYLVSNRQGGMGLDDIYLLKLRQGIASLAGPTVGSEALTLYDASNSRRVTNAAVWVAEADPAGRLNHDFYTFQVSERAEGRQLEPTLKPIGQLPPTALRTDREGTLRLEFKTGKAYEVIIHKNGYAPERLRIVYTEDGPSRPLDITLQPAQCRIICGHVMDATGGAIGQVPVQFRPQNCSLAGLSTITDVTGNFELCVPASCDYSVIAGRAGYQTRSVVVPAAELLATERPVVNLILSAEGNVSRPGNAAQNAIMPLRGINFFDGTAILQEDISSDVTILLKLLRQRPDLQLLLISHTDGPQPPEALVRQGEQRAEAVRQALLKKGIAPNRLRTIAYGNAYRKSPCDRCTATDYAVNNRMEAKVISW